LVAKAKPVSAIVSFDQILGWYGNQSNKIILDRIVLPARPDPELTENIPNKIIIASDKGAEHVIRSWSNEYPDSETDTIETWDVGLSSDGLSILCKPTIFETADSATRMWTNLYEIFLPKGNLRVLANLPPHWQFVTDNVGLDGVLVAVLQNTDSERRAVFTLDRAGAMKEDAEFPDNTDLVSISPSGQWAVSEGLDESHHSHIWVFPTDAKSVSQKPDMTSDLVLRTVWSADSNAIAILKSHILAPKKSEVYVMRLPLRQISRIGGSWYGPVAIGWTPKSDAIYILSENKVWRVNANSLEVVSTFSIPAHY
jgi:hypothetical protein